MNFPSTASQCSSSGCESGWTFYLDQSSTSHHNHDDSHQYHQTFGGYINTVDMNDGRVKERRQMKEEETEDLSMVSDASSGPPLGCNYYEEGEDSIGRLERKDKNTSRKSKKSSRSSQCQFVDDTASSPVLNGKKVGGDRARTEELSQGLSATHFKGKSSKKKKNHFGFFRSSE